MRQPPDPILGRVRVFLQAHGLLRPDARLLVAVSGGPDSLCLLHLLHRLRAESGPELHVAHLDHGLRPAAAAEAVLVRATAEAWAIPATIERHEVRAQPGDEGLMDAARRVRYAFLAETALAAGANAVAVAHQADDQAETLLLHLMRGAGLAGLRGMREAVPWAEWKPAQGPEGVVCNLIRPLLTTPRAAIEAYCAERGLTTTADPSNADERFGRPRVRRLLRELAAENPRIVAALGRTAALSADDYALIQGQLDELWPTLAQEGDNALLLHRAPFLALHPSLQRYAVRRAVTLLGAAELSFEQVEAARALATKAGRTMTLAPHLSLAIDQLTLAFAQSSNPPIPLSPHPLVPPSPCPPIPLSSADEIPLTVPGSTELGDGWVCVTSVEPPSEPSVWWVALNPAALDGPLALRTRRPGDRFRPVGGRGSRKLQDFFVDQKVPRDLRDRWPILATPSAVVWVVGLRADARFVAADQSQGTIWVGVVRP